MTKERATRASATRTRRQYSTGDADLDRRLTALVEELKLAPVDARSTYELLVTAIRMAEEPLSRLDREAGRRGLAGGGGRRPRRRPPQPNRPGPLEPGGRHRGSHRPQREPTGE